jgi:hypothetical protein
MELFKFKVGDMTMTNVNTAKIIACCNADEITGFVANLTNKTSDGVTAKQWARKFVLAELKGAEHQPPRTHGHVVVVGDLAHGKYPTAYWGSLGGVGKQNETLNWAWAKADRDRIMYGTGFWW